MQAAHRDAQPQLVQPLLQQAHGVGQILQQFGFGAELDEERLVLRANHLRKKLGSRALFGVDQPLLAGAGVDQQAEGQRQVGFAREVLDLLFLAVFVNLEVVFAGGC